jgi:hypothetical protein
MRKTIVQFLDMFNDIVIARHNQDTGEIIKYIKVPLRFAPKTKQWYWTEYQNAEERSDWVLPMMGVELEQVEYAKDRQVNRNHQITVSSDGDSVKRFYNPVPYDFTFRVQIAAQYMVDITQIVEQIFPFFTPEAYIRITLPDLNIEGLDDGTDGGVDKLDLRVVYESSSKDTPVELDEANFRVLLWNLTFKVQGYLFSPVTSSAPIHNVITNYYVDEQALADGLGNEDLRIGELNTQVMQGLHYATDIPDDDTPIDDDIKEMYKYEHFEKNGPDYEYDPVNDDVVWLEDDDGNPVEDDIDRNLRE